MKWVGEGRKTGAGLSVEGLPSPKGTDQQSFAVYTIEEKFLMKLLEKCWLRKCGEYFIVLLLLLGSRAESKL